MGEKKAYDKIYLIGWYEEYPRPGDFGDEVTWCQDPIGENDECPDIEYIRADIHEKANTRANARIAELESVLRVVGVCPELPICCYENIKEALRQSD